MLVCSQWIQNPTWCGSSALVSGVGLGSAAMGWKFGSNGWTPTQWRRHGWREFSGNGRRWVVRAGSRWYVVWGNRKLRLWESWIQWRHFKFHTGGDYSWRIHEFNLSSIPNIQQHSRVRGSVGAARKVSPNWSHETMNCHSSNCFSIVWGQGNAPLVPHVRPDRPSADELCNVASALRMRTVMLSQTWLYAVWHTPGEIECTFYEFSGLLKEN